MDVPSLLSCLVLEPPGLCSCGIGLTAEIDDMWFVHYVNAEQLHSVAVVDDADTQVPLVPHWPGRHYHVGTDRHVLAFMASALLSGLLSSKRHTYTPL